ncbi:MAG: class D beta-lactamase [Bacteroidales bacterium]|nr:class D beta-lactamase [Bacteroidales bacterium]
MKNLLLTFLVISVFTASCNQNVEKTNQSQGDTERKIVIPKIQQIIDSANVKGSVLIFNPQTDVYYSNDFEWAQIGKLPASTFKVPNSIIALETGIIESDSTILKWDGEKRNLARWEKDLSFRDAFQLSCVPCYQDIARNIGVERMIENLDKLGYDGMKLDSNSIDRFWLVGSSSINQFQQIDFLSRFYNNKLPISQQTHSIMKRMMQIDKTMEYTLSGKTGWSYYKETDNGWFVGYIEKEDNVFYFATNIEPGDGFNMDLFPLIRQKITMEVMGRLEIINK